MTRKKTTKADAGLPLDSKPEAGAETSERRSPKMETEPETPDQTPKPESEAGTEPPPKDEAPENTGDEDAADSPQPATGVIPVFVLADGPLGEHGRVVRVSRRKLADLGLIQSEHWREPTAQELAIGL